MKIRFDCADNCRHTGVCKYFDDMKKIDESLKAINSEGRDHVMIHVECKHHVGMWGGGVRDGK